MSKHQRTKMRLIVLIALTVSCFMSAFGLEAPSAAVIAQKVDHYYNQLHTLRAHFTETYEGTGIAKSEEGSLLLSKPSAMRWDYQSPHSKLFLMDGKSAYFYVVGEPTAQKMDARKLDDLRSPLRFLLGKTRLESELDNLHLLDPTDPQEFRLEGVPKGMQTRVSKVTLTVNNNGQITVLRVEERDGTVTTFKFSDFNANPEIPRDMFRFEPPPGVTIVLRTGS